LYHINALTTKKMKKYVLLIVITGFITLAHAQSIDVQDVPETVTDAFSKAYPTISDVDWSKEGINYAVSYAENKLGRSVTWAASGDLIGAKEEIVISELPITAMVYVKKNYNEEVVKDASKNTDAQGTVIYKAEITGMDLFFDSDGNFLKSVDN
jgi:hypothetical protein